LQETLRSVERRKTLEGPTVKFSNLRITPKLGILVAMTLLGLAAAGVLAGWIMQREMLDARIDQTKAIVDIARNTATALQKQVDAGQLTKEQALAEFTAAPRR